MANLLQQLATSYASRSLPTYYVVGFRETNLSQMHRADEIQRCHTLVCFDRQPEHRQIEMIRCCSHDGEIHVRCRFVVASRAPHH